MHSYFYANTEYFRDSLDELVIEKGASLKLIVLDAESINRIDSTGVEMLRDRVLFYQKRGVLFFFAGMKGPVRDSVFKGGLLDVISINHFLEETLML